ncbi:hypothetical protein MSSAC_2634 [Methanosarcina siciliae C2J]|uniref:Uncharacterized protein n=1 Tax=Methanosarcina siciliae C2J TaxID=1434118 RepID=A0A0E3PPQ6_9EURY|nr:hypothetical protein MSSAC_2634 [Methanosarcina siciliae C2J]
MVKNLNSLIRIKAETRKDPRVCFLLPSYFSFPDYFRSYCQNSSLTFFSMVDLYKYDFCRQFSLLIMTNM